MTEKKTIFNSWLVSFFLFQFGILLPFALFANIEIPYIISTLIILASSLYINNLNFNKVFIISSIALLFIVNLSFIFHSIEIDIILMILGGFIAKGLSGFYLTSNKINFEHLYKSLVILAWINLIILSISIFSLNLNENVGYMRLGYAIVPSSIILLGKVMLSKYSISSLLGFFLSVLMLLLYGNRGVFIVIIFFILFIVLFFYQKNIKTFLYMLIAVTILYFIFSLDLISRLVLYLFEDLNIYSYTLMKFTKSFEEGFISASSGREVLYLEGFNRFMENPIFGNGIGYTFTYTTTSAHNFLLQILIESGILGFFITILIFLVLIYYIKTIKDKTVLMSLAVFFSLSIGRLSVSSDLWLRPELWMLFGLLISIINFNKANKSKKYVI